MSGDKRKNKYKKIKFDLNLKCKKIEIINSNNGSPKNLDEAIERYIKTFDPDSLIK